MSTDGLGEGNSRLVARALCSILRPLARVAVARGLTLSALLPVLKSVLVEAAAEELARRGERPTQSRISVLSGVHRKDVRALQQQPGEVSGAREPVSLAESVVGRWLGDPRYRGAQGRPLALPQSGPAPSFGALVAGVSTDVRPRTVLDELKRLGFVAHDEAGDRIELRTEAFVPSADEVQLLRLFEANLADHASAAAANVTGDDGPFLERAVYYTHLSPESVSALAKEARVHSGRLLERLNARALAEQDRGEPRPPRLQRFRFGVYFYREDMPEADAGASGPGGEASGESR